MTTELELSMRRPLSLSLRLMRIVLFLVLVVAIATELSLSNFWLVTLSVLAVYAFITGVLGRDPVFGLFKLSSRELSTHALGRVEQLECLTIGLICIVAGIMLRNVDSLVLPLLPFIGIYPMILCAVKHDLLGYLLQSYRKNVRG